MENEGPFNVALARGQDMDFSTRLQKAGGRMLLLPDTSSEYFARSTIRSFWTQNWNNGVWAILPFAYSESLSISVAPPGSLGFCPVGDSDGDSRWRCRHFCGRVPGSSACMAW